MPCLDESVEAAIGEPALRAHVVRRLHERLHLGVGQEHYLAANDHEFRIELLKGRQRRVRLRLRPEVPVDEPHPQFAAATRCDHRTLGARLSDNDGDNPEPTGPRTPGIRRRSKTPAELRAGLADVRFRPRDEKHDALNIMETLIRSNSIDVIVLDSVAALITKAELDTEFAHWHDQMRGWVNGFIRGQQGNG